MKKQLQLSKTDEVIYCQKDIQGCVETDLKFIYIKYNNSGAY